MPKAKPTKSPSTPMPSANIELGSYVTLRWRADGTARVFFQVPARVRPSGWPSLIPLPRGLGRTGNLQDAAEVARIQADARQLKAELLAARKGLGKVEGKTFKTLIRRYQESDAWRDLRPKTQKSYTSYINHIQAWADFHPSATPISISRADIDAMLATWRDRPVTKKHVRKMLRLLLECAISLGWRVNNPCDGIRIRVPKSVVSIWEQEDVDAYVKAADRLGRNSIARIILLEWQIGQRLTDVRGFRSGAEFDAATGVFRFRQSKTGSYVTIPIGPRLSADLKDNSVDQLFLFNDEDTGKAYTEERLSRVFGKVRAAAIKAGARPLLLRWLRHSCIVQLARAGNDIPAISAVTGHSPASAAKILSTYLPRDTGLARSAQIKRGLVEG